MTHPQPPLAQVVALATDRAGLGASAPALLLETQSDLGRLAALAAQATDRGRRPFRPDAAWVDALGQLAFGVFVLADQTGVEVETIVRAAADRVGTWAPSPADHTEDDWPFTDA